MAAEGNDFNINLGDTIYSDSSVGGLPPALTVPAKRRKYQENLGCPRFAACVRPPGSTATGTTTSSSTTSPSRSTAPPSSRRAGPRSRPTRPSRWSPGDGLYRRIRWGRTLELFFLDERSFRSAKASVACKGDLAPTAPQAVRNAFAAIAPGLAQPVDPACLAVLNDPARTMLGARQYAAFTRGDRRFDGDVEGRRQRGADAAVLRVAVRPLGGVRRRAGAAARVPRSGSATSSSSRPTRTRTSSTRSGCARSTRPGRGGTGIWEVVTGPGRDEVVRARGRRGDRRSGRRRGDHGRCS